MERYSMANKKDTDNQLVDILKKHYKTFRDFLSYPPAHNEIDPYFSGCIQELDLIRVEEIKNTGNTIGYNGKTMIVVCECRLHSEVTYRYRATIRATKKGYAHF
jgi:hypothetical protein